MRAILIAVGNPLRRDDGVAKAALELVGISPDVEARSLVQLAPEVASDIAAYDTVVFLDADAGAREIRVEAVKEDEATSSRALTHVSHPAEIVALARELFRFAGRAFVCRIPAVDFSVGEGLSRRAKVSARRAAAAMEGLLHKMRSPNPASNPKTVRADA